MTSIAKSMPLKALEEGVAKALSSRPGDQQIFVQAFIPREALTPFAPRHGDVPLAEPETVTFREMGEEYLKRTAAERARFRDLMGAVIGRISAAKGRAFDQMANSDPNRDAILSELNHALHLIKMESQHMDEEAR